MIKRTLFFGNPAYLSLRQKQLVVQQPDIENNDTLPEIIKKQSERTIPIEDIGVVVLDNQRITITSGAVSALLANNVAVITCNEQCMPEGLLMPLESNTLQHERFEAQIKASLPLRKQLWAQTIRQKILNQEYVLRKYSNGVESSCMRVWASNVRSGDPENLEGRAAAYYWKNVFPDIPNFVRGRESSPPNNLLNYGYTILRAVIARNLVASGLLPTLGIHHHNRYNAYCLADDIMEPYRPYVDELVLKIRSQFGEIKELTRDIKAQLLQIPGIDVIVDGKRSPLMIGAGLTTASLAKCYQGEIRNILYPTMLE